MLSLLATGGWLMAPILVLAVIAVAIILERFWYLRANYVLAEPIFDQAFDLLEHPAKKLAQWRDKVSHSPLGYMLVEGLEAKGQGRLAMEERMETAGRHAVLALERHLGTLGTIAAVSPLLGLLGTVFGMIKSFGALSASAQVDALALASGISEALLTTAAGLLIAIPCLFFYRYFQRRIDVLAALLEQHAKIFIERADQQRESHYAVST
ncbi:Biopolymer transport protein ExbB [Piscirickettsia salmonis]|uniref:MotA/TolQ/ExbB proton channel family protein n=2 Tax=Piscirickettsia salmonis TaxID=1238 RepID=A0A1L6TBS8_PISSA|nr:MotA/TolQ/ExbB proton channel family protein [Piscirickettsia salmonis]AIE90158.1 biopolymer transport protein ExbB/TolQ/MotA [Piscirickettsia salmonis LF-89 = ATCC VR-1361]AKP73954.1 biopolymer transporter ExbB [Piscirickettsia salmonis LF-89 = ATCC VR-1361]ALB22788.1 motA/TolQ/ExbB proton channel family protein [Piscirickettsia salmonis]ALY02777.1 biopolymer transporter ExbB [Piscirickettsia salmonis]AMA42325.1 biopolymer transporter ExbB [Piscirickettsia salmonis]